MIETGFFQTVDSEGGLAVILAVKHLKINILAWVPRKINTCK